MSTDESCETHPEAILELENGELVSRFIYSKSHMSTEHHRPKPDAFNPLPDKPLSVVHTTGLPDRDVWEIGRLHALVDKPGRDKIRGRADMPVKALIKRNLRAIRDDNPFARHTSVIGWPRSSDPDQRKQQLKDLCLALSQDPEIKLIIPENPVTNPA
jgi:hypothetical protein